MTIDRTGFHLARVRLRVLASIVTLPIVLWSHSSYSQDAGIVDDSAGVALQARTTESEGVIQIT